MSFPVEENAVDMFTRQIGWEKRKRVKEATTVTAATATKSFSFLLDSIKHLFFFSCSFPARILCLVFSLYIYHIPRVLSFSHIRLKRVFIKIALDQYIYREIWNRNSVMSSFFIKHLFQLTNRICDIGVKTFYVNEAMRILNLRTSY